MNWTDPTPREVRLAEAMAWERRAFPIDEVVSDAEAALICADYPLPTAGPRPDGPAQPARSPRRLALVRSLFSRAWL